MAVDIKKGVNLDLHPDTVTTIEGYDDDVAIYLQPTREAFNAAYQFIGNIYEVRAAAMADPTLTPAAALLKADDYAQQRLSGVTRKFDTVMANLAKSIAHLENELAAPVKARASLMVSGEVRAAMKAADNRMALVQKAIAEGDEEVASAVLGAPALLSGMSREMHQHLLVMYHSAREPAKAAQLRAMRGAKERLEQRSGLVFREMTKAVGTLKHPNTGQPIHPQDLRKRRDASAAAYAQLA